MDEDDYRLSQYTRLRKGERLFMPDLNGDGLIQNQQCEPRGMLTFDARYDRRTGAVEKALEYNGRKISAK